MSEKHQPVALITGSARRVGACIAETFHQAGYAIIVHYRHSDHEANRLVEKCNQQRAHSAIALSADLDDVSHYEKLIHEAHREWARLDVLVNNASSFAPTPIGKITAADWDHLLNCNLKAPIFLSQAAAPFLSEKKGNIVNITDIHSVSPMKAYSVYSCAKAGLSMLTKSLALELAPHVRVNAVAPGSVIWPEGINTLPEKTKEAILSATLLHKQVAPEDIANAVLFLAQQDSITGQTIAVDGGRFY
ncbi:MAG: pteridine reductase [Gammaproteobacteria bacterium CG_4_10_14_0_8_um_filter_38_16]|nr:MAG: pteridine reductase [Gammaproteobacteria bacterium CG_4_10_14_0_8_um_filter_38_16]PJA03155.1 MAG: pteridine reductase [Gammaproteobacteria bacterium CG_4_10_14_0_2_um_filter_38_22]PJB10538.1 MAG: pteridine reductase [Gammaproteobacteria bacterium CG_4_9_14_3_um_filter_38_9]